MSALTPVRGRVMHGVAASVLGAFAARQAQAQACGFSVVTDATTMGEGAYIPTVAAPVYRKARTYCLGTTTGAPKTETWTALTREVKGLAQVTGGPGWLGWASHPSVPHAADAIAAMALAHRTDQSKALWGQLFVHLAHLFITRLVPDYPTWVRIVRRLSPDAESIAIPAHLLEADESVDGWALPTERDLRRHRLARDLTADADR